MNNSDNTKEKIKELFRRCFNTAGLEYPPKPKIEIPPANAGPTAITLEEYKKRNNKAKKPTEPVKNKKKSRGGKKFQKRKQLAILYREYNLEENKEKKYILKKEIVKTRKL